MIIWDYVKGLNEQGDSYTYIKFPTTTEGTAHSLIQPTPDSFYKNVASIYTTGKVNNAYINELTGSTYNKVDFGKILTSHDYIELTRKYQNNLNIYLQNSATINDESNYYFQIVNKFIDGTTYPLKLDLKTNNIDIIGNFKIENGSNKIEFEAANGNITTTGGIATKGSIVINSDKIQLTSDGKIIAADKCEAVYFNATSDMRAKTNLRPLTLNACDYIKQIPIYSFQYKNNTKPSIGVLAQDLTCKPIDESANNFNFVDNKEATGIDNDYMSVKESKFVYLCMKAIQELTDENRNLMCKINDLENKINQLQK